MGRKKKDNKQTNDRGVLIIDDEVKLKEETNKVLQAADKFYSKLKELKAQPGLSLLRMIKFDTCGYNPESPNEKANFIEQVNQTFTALVSFKAVKWLWENGHKGKRFELNLCTQSGSDITETNVVAEACAVVKSTNNNKLRKDIKRVCDINKLSKYVFYTSSKPVNLKKGLLNHDETNIWVIQENGQSLKVVYFTIDEIMDFAKAVQNKD
jgi:hypothetical protein